MFLKNGKFDFYRVYLNNMKLWDNILKGVILVIGFTVIAFNVLLYSVYEQQKAKLSAMRDKLDVEAEFNSNKFKYQSDQIERLSKGIESAQQQIKSQNDDLAAQKDALLQEAEKRQQMESESKGIQNALVDIKAEADAIKQDMKGWQKDYVSVLAQLDKKMDDSQVETKSIETNLVALNIPELKENIDSLKADIEKITPPVNNALLGPPAASVKKVERTDLQFQQ